MSEKRLKSVQFLPLALMWAISAVLSLLDWFALRAATVSIADVTRRAVPMEVQIKRQWYLRWVVRAADPCSLVFFSIFAFASILAFEYIYRDAIKKGVAKKRFALVTGIQVGILVVCGIILLVTNLAW